MAGKLAALADIHGNIWALDAVLEDLDRLGCDGLVNLGDSFYGPLAPAATAKRLLAIPRLISIRGNQDRLLLKARVKPGIAGDNPTLGMVLNEISGAVWRWLEELPPHLIIQGEWFCCHGTPRDDSAYLIEDVASGRPVMRGPEALGARLDAARGMNVLCGHSHLPWSLAHGNRLLVNPGSVGLPAYADEDPPHVMEAGSPHARYVIIEDGESGPVVSLRRVDYDVERAVLAAKKNGREDWAAWLQTGKAGG